jgi:uncharacterized protein
MAELKDRLRTDLTAAMKARDGLRASTLRMALTAISNAEVAGKQARVLNDEEVTSVLVAESKKRREAARAFDEAGRDELATKEKAEAEILAAYLPEPLTDEELTALVDTTVDTLGVGGQGMAAMGAVMARLKPLVAGRANGAAVAALVRRRLTAG